jgi:hypothetical protein
MPHFCNEHTKSRRAREPDFVPAANRSKQLDHDGDLARRANSA